MPAPCCARIKPNGQPCAARPLPGSDFCLFHDPAHQQSLGESRSKGGSTPRRRLRRFPRLLDHMHVAELLGELFIDSLNNPDAIDTRRLQALTALSRTLLKAVGTPPTFLVHSDRREPSPSTGHLLRVYPPLAPEVEALLAAEPPAEPPAAPGTPPPPPAGSPVDEIRTIDAGDGAAWNAAAAFVPIREASTPPVALPPLGCRCLVDIHAPLEELATVGLPPNHVAAADPPLPANAEASLAAEPPAALAADPHPVTPDPERPNAPTPERLIPEQVLNRSRTGPLPINVFRDLLLAALLPRPSAQPPTPRTQDVAKQSTANTMLPAPAATPDAATPAERLNARTPERLIQEQVVNKPPTGLPATEAPAATPLSAPSSAEQTETLPSPTQSITPSVPPCLRVQPFPEPPAPPPPFCALALAGPRRLIRGPSG